MAPTLHIVAVGLNMVFGVYPAPTVDLEERKGARDDVARWVAPRGLSDKFPGSWRLPCIRTVTSRSARDE